MKVNRKILVFARELAPYCNSVGSSLRAITLSAHLADAGLDVKLVGAKGIFVSNFGLEHYLSKLNIIYIDDLLQKYYTKKAQIIKSKDAAGKASFIKSALFKLIALMRNVTVPDVAVLFLPKYVWYILHECKKTNPHYLLVSSPPHSSQLIIIFARIFGPKNTKLIVDYRDGWNTFDLFMMKINFLRRISEFLERTALESCDLFIYQSPKVLEDINYKYKFNHALIKKSLLMRNGYTNMDAATKDVETFKFVASEDSYNLGYFGNIDFTKGGWRDPTPLLALLDQIGYRINFYTVGQVSNIPTVKIFKNINIIPIPTVDLASAKLAMKRFDSLFVFHSAKTGASEVIPGKFYEYIQSNVPIFVYGPSEMECGRLVEEYSFGIFVKSSDSINAVNDKFKLLLDDVYVDRCKVSMLKNQHLFSRESQYGKLVDWLEVQK